MGLAKPDIIAIADGSPLRENLTEIHHYEPAGDGDQGMYDMLDPHDSGAASMNVLDCLDQLAALMLGQTSTDLV
jgi:hypothetical protein